MNGKTAGKLSVVFYFNYICYPMKKLIYVLLLFWVAAPLNYLLAQGYKINIDLPEEGGKKLTLANYYLDNIYACDTTWLDNSGTGTFKSDTLLPQGLYKIMIDQDHHFDFLLGADQQFSIKNTSFSPETAEINGAIETEEFENYLHFLTDLRKENTDLKTKLNIATTPGERKNIQEQINELTQKLQQYWFHIKEKYPDSFLSKFLLAGYVPELDISTLPAEIQANDSLLLLKRFYYQQKHFWDYLDYTDERFLYTPVFKPKLETWFTKVLFQDYDSVREPVLKMIEEVKPNPRIFQFVLSWFLNSTINSTVLGMDALFVELAQKYYLNGEAFWATDKTLEKIRENVLFHQNNLIGETGQDMSLETVDGEFMNLHKIDAKITIVLIFEPNCSHCQEFVPKFHDEVYEKFKNKGLAVYAIYSMDNKEEWTEFLTKHQLYDWINVWDPNNNSNFKVLYDARETPGVYVLDENKTIIAKRYSVEQLEMLLNDKLKD